MFINWIFCISLLEMLLLFAENWKTLYCLPVVCNINSMLKYKPKCTFLNIKNNDVSGEESTITSGSAGLHLSFTVEVEDLLLAERQRPRLPTCFNRHE